MKISDYQLASARTCASLGSVELDLSHMVLGMVSEVEELIDAASKNDNVGVGEELTDQMFYIANYCTFRGLDMEELFAQQWSYTGVKYEGAVAYSALSDLVKKFIAYKREIDVEKESNILKCILIDIGEMYVNWSLDMETCLQNNVDKLLIRYPVSFDSHSALNRDLDAERKELEKV